jgi:hypothetical protein
MLRTHQASRTDRLEPGSGVLTAGTPRPCTHALWVLVLLAVAALLVLATLPRPHRRP